MQKRKALQERTVQKVLERRTVQRRTLVQERNVQEVLGNVSLIILYIKLDHFFYSMCCFICIFVCLVSIRFYNYLQRNSILFYNQCMLSFLRFQFVTFYVF